MLVLEWKDRVFMENKMWTPDVFVNFRRPYIWVDQNWVHQYGVSIQSSTKVRETFRQITQKLCPRQTRDLDKLFIYLSFIAFHFLGFFHWTIFNLSFCCVTVKTIYTKKSKKHEMWQQQAAKITQLLAAGRNDSSNEPGEHSAKCYTKRVHQPSRPATPYLFWQKRYPFRIPSIDKWHPL